jgi:hypothetical protein
MGVLSRSQGKYQLKHRGLFYSRCPEVSASGRSPNGPATGPYQAMNLSLDFDASANEDSYRTGAAWIVFVGAGSRTATSVAKMLLFDKVFPVNPDTLKIPTGASVTLFPLIWLPLPCTKIPAWSL